MWSYRVYKNDQGEYGIIEYYQLDTGVARTDFVKPYGETLEELAFDINHYKAALEQPVLTSKDFENDSE